MDRQAPSPNSLEQSETSLEWASALWIRLGTPFRLVHARAAARFGRLFGLDPVAPQPDIVAMCPHCNYNVAGLTSNVCPECGRSFNKRSLYMASRRLDHALHLRDAAMRDSAVLFVAAVGALVVLRLMTGSSMSALNLIVTIIVACFVIVGSFFVVSPAAFARPQRHLLTLIRFRWLFLLHLPWILGLSGFLWAAEIAQAIFGREAMVIVGVFGVFGVLGVVCLAWMIFWAFVNGLESTLDLVPSRRMEMLEFVSTAAGIVGSFAVVVLFVWYF